MSRVVTADGPAVELPAPAERANGPAHVHTQCELDPDVAIYIGVYTWAGEVTATLYLGKEQVAIQVTDPETWERLASVAVQGARDMRAALNAHTQADDGAVVELASAERK